MNVYSHKRRWKILLFLFATGIIISSFLYTNYIVNKISQDERQKVTLWAEAIKRKALLVSYTQELFNKLAESERKKVELWSEATKLLASTDYEGDFGFLLKVIADNSTIPVILTDDQGAIVSYRNIEFPKEKNKSYYLLSLLDEMKLSANNIEISFYGEKKNYLYYKDSKLFSELKSNMNDLIQSFISEIVINGAGLPVVLMDMDQKKMIAYGNIKKDILSDSMKLKEYIIQMKKENTPIEIKLENEKIHYIYYSNSEIYYLLRYYPAVQFLFIGLFILSAYWIFSSYRKAEQNNVWAGMAKETAHQLGTPISSLMAWVEYLKIKEVDSSILTEIDKDIVRLQVVADRFSKIGSVPELQLNHLMETIAETVNYMQKRCSSSIHINFINHCNTTHIFFNKVLLEWVIENIIRNAIDSLEKGKGNITVNTTENAHQVIVDITDTGKGIPSHKLKTIFEPGYTTKKRGWGLGLSLSKRIIEKFHNGKIFVKQSELNKGTTFRIVLNKPI